MNLKRLFAFITFLLVTVSLNAQLFPPKNYPQHYFTWPVIAKKTLAANFGELRPNHYHMGLDCKTDQHENVQVVAAADGYIAKVKIEPIGFGRCIYINHPNGLTTLYAHLNEFNPALEKYVTEQQYQLKSWSIFIDIPTNLFPVKQGQFIAYSGNTGGSQGPHTHFEIRDTKTDKVLNPLLFGMPITDNIAPDILRIAVYDRTKSTYEQTPHFYSIRKQNGVYITSPSLINLQASKISFAITAYDRYTGSTNRNGIYQSVLYEDNQPVVGFQMDSISYDETRYINAHIDYKLKDNGGSFIQHLSRLPGYVHGIYQDISGDGVLDLSDEAIHQIKIEVSDVNGNTSVVNFSVKGIKAANNKEAPVSENRFVPNSINIFENNFVQLYLPENCIYDFFDFKYNQIISPSGNVIYQLENGGVPAQSKFSIKLKAAPTPYFNKMVMHYFWKEKNDYDKAVPQNIFTEKDWYKSSFRAFGNFELLIDTIPPVITPIGFFDGMNCKNKNSIAFAIKDNTELLQNFDAELDGNWLRFSNDKGRVFVYKFDAHCPPGSHVLKISVEDCVGNRAEKTYHFTK